jgi:hypothetical protein
VQGACCPTFLSNVNACYPRTRWIVVGGSPDVAYVDPRALGADILLAGRAYGYRSGIAARRAHDSDPLAFVRRRFEKYGELWPAAWYIEPLCPRATGRAVGTDLHG